MLAFLFPGQGSQSFGMGRALFDNFQEARDVLEIVEDTCHYPLGSYFLDGDGEEAFAKTATIQLSIFTVSMAVLKVMEHHFKFPWKNYASHVAGHSLGEYTALCAVGTLSLEEGARLIYQRSQATDHCLRSLAAEGASYGMGAVVGLDQATLAPFIENPDVQGLGPLFLANDNSPQQTVLSGSLPSLHKVFEDLKKSHSKVKTVVLEVPGPFHTPLMKGALDQLKDALSSLTFHAPSLPLVSNVSGAEETDPAYLKTSLLRHMVQPVRWRESMEFMFKQGLLKFAEIGPGKVLTGLVKKNHTTGFPPESTPLLHPFHIEEFVRTHSLIG